ncbi:MAG: hydrogenase formation protein HypD [Candidatus Diapherotrites archaeon]|nr:hydrogenase formation protein HypD [Candidatus Diapherotrites archaeon]
MLLRKIKELNPKRDINIMEVCGTHTQTIAKYALNKVLPGNIHLISGPGCPVCVTPSSEIDSAIEVSKKTTITTFGDMYRVPGTRTSLSEGGGDAKVVYSIADATKLARENPDKQIVHFAIGFETTTPSTAVEVLGGVDNFSIICSHKLIPPAMDFLLSSGECKIDAFLCPGHVSTIIGSKPYEPIAEKYEKPCVIAGFEPEDVLLSVYMMLKQMKKNEPKVEIEYKRVVKPEGNETALKAIKKAFNVCDSNWRGIGKIKNSGLELRGKFKKFDAKKKFDISVDGSIDIKPGCRCGEIMRGLARPSECPLFKKACTPDSPVGPCMVSVEGACNVAFRFGG